MSPKNILKNLKSEMAKVFVITANTQSTHSTQPQSKTDIHNLLGSTFSPAWS